MIITNHSDIPLPLAVWAVSDEYDYKNDPKYISATTLLKPLRQIILQRRVNYETLTTDVEDMLARAMGSSIHKAIEHAWVQHYKENLSKLGMPDKAISSIRINPNAEEEGTTNIYFEQRAIREFKGWKIGGQYDMVLDGNLNDFKSTTTMKWISGSSDQDYKMQGSIYKWLNPDKITGDYIRINFIFTDWSRLESLKNKDYPKHRACYKDILLLSPAETENWLRTKLTMLDKYMDTPEESLPECPSDSLWREPTKYKYFLNPKAARATKNFENIIDARNYQAQKKGIGVIKIVPGRARRCEYCSASSICSQYKKMIEGQ